MKLHIVMHESFESPAAIKIWAEKKGCTLSYTRLYQGDTLPSNCNAFDFLIIMGGPQSPATTTKECSYFNATQEIALIKKAIDNNKFILGICLGAQLIGEAFGAKFDQSPNKEIGVFELQLTDVAKKDPVFSAFPNHFLAAHWHGDMPGLTSDTKILASSKGCPRQIVRYAPKIYGFQCHFEFTHEAIEGMITHCSDELIADKNLPYVQRADELRKYDYAPINKLLFKFLDKIELSHREHPVEQHTNLFKI